MLEITAGRNGLLRRREPSDGIIIFEDVGQDEEVKRLRESESMKRSFLSIISPRTAHPAGRDPGAPCR